jgi:tRNA threonylcarbamoyladenosine biosynthesis protein TsaE
MQISKTVRQQAVTAQYQYDVTKMDQLLYFAEQFSRLIKPGMVFYLLGDLGAGKTTLTQLILKYLGIEQLVLSPTYSILEVYETNRLTVLHLDLYRLRDETELQALALRDYMDLQPVWFIEWPTAYRKRLPPATLTLKLEFNAQIKKRSIAMDVQASDAFGFADLKWLKDCKTDSENP